MNKFISIVKSSVFKRLIIVLLLLILFIFISAISYVSAVSNNIANGVFRLHVIANSDSPEDQNLKYIVRDELIKYMNTLAKDCTSKQEVIEIAQNNISNFENIAKKTIQDNGFNYKTDYYDLYGLKFFSEYYDQNMGLLMTSFYTDNNKEILTIHHQNEAFLVNTNYKTNVFYSYREFVQYVESFMKG